MSDNILSIYLFIYFIYREIIIYSQRVVTPMCISLDLKRIWPNKV